MRSRILRNFLLSALFSLLAVAGITQSISTSPGGQIGNFSATYGANNVAPKTFTFTGSGFAPAQNVEVFASAEFEVSPTLGGPYSSSFVLAANGSGNFTSTSVFVRMVDNTVPGTYSSRFVGFRLVGSPTNITTKVIATTIITPIVIDIINIDIPSKVYDGSNAATISNSGGPISLGAGVLAIDALAVNLVTSGATAVFDNPNVGSNKNITITGYTLSGPASSNYILNQPSGYQSNITPKPLTVSGLSVANKAYDGTNVFTLSGTATLNGVEPGDVSDVSLAGSFSATSANASAETNKTITTSNPGLTGPKASNYTLTTPSFTADITKKALTIAATAVNKIYGTTLTGGSGYSAFTATGIVGSENPGTVTVTYAAGAAGNENVGVYNNAIQLSSLTGGSGGFDANNYNINYTNASITVTPKALSISGVGANNKPYDGNSDATISGTASLVGVEFGDDCTLNTSGATAAFASINASNNIQVNFSGYALSGTKAGNYTLNQPSSVNANIEPKALTITANSVNKTYGDALVSGAGATAFTVSGLVPGETIASITLTYGGAAAATAGVGPAVPGSIVPSAPVSGVGFLSSNYTIAFVSGAITVTPRALSIAATPVNKVYGDVLTNGTGYTGFTATGLQNGETAGTVSVAYGAGANATDPVGTTLAGVAISALTGGTINPANYSINYTGTDLNVTPRTLNITANNLSVMIGAVLTGGAGSSDFVATGLQNGETAGTVTITYTGVGPTAGVYAGSVVPSALTGGSITPSNYTINYIAGDVTVSAGSITITANNENKPYGTTLTSGAGKTTFTVTGTLQPGESITSVTLTYGAGSTSGAGLGANPGEIIPSLPVGTGGFIASNYIITYVNGDITVTTAPLTITANNESKVYGATLTSGAGKTTYTISSGTLAGSETISSVTLTYGAGAAATDAVGTTAGTIVASAPVGANGFVATNYNITFVPGNITVTPAPLTITANAVSKFHGETIASPATGVTAFTSTGLQNGETIGSVTMDYGPNAASGGNLGVYPGAVVPSAATGGTFNASNYTIAYVANQLSVVPNNNAFLSNLVASTGPLNTAFNKYDLDYDTYVLTAIDQFTVTATVENQFATIQARIDTGMGPGAYIPLTSGVASAPFLIREGDNIIEILVTAEDGTTQLNYRILYRRESSFVSGGGGGGLESKSLGDAIAQRVLNNAINDMNGAVDYNKLPVVETAQGTIRSTSTNSIFSLQLSSIMPDLSNRGYKAYNSSPVDIVSFTNAKEVFAVDYVNTNKETKAVAFTTKTLGELYDHTKPICDRLKGATLLDVESVKIDGYDFINYTIRNDKGNLEYATAFTVGAKAGRNNFNLQSAFLTTSYVNEDQMYNFQIWAASPSIVNDMVKEVLAKLKDVAPVNQSIVNASPDTYIESGKREGANLKLVIKNGTAATTGFFKFEDRSNESSTGIVTRNVPFTVAANGTSTISVPVGDKYESSISMFLNGEVKDMLYMSDGTWAIDYNRNTTSVSAFTVSNDAKRVISANEYPVLRNVEVKANSSDFVSLFKLLKAGGMEADLSGYAGLKFTAAGGYNLRVTMVQNGISEWKNQYTTDIRLGSGQQEYFIPFSQFKSAASTKNIDPKDVTTLVFTVEVNAGRNSPIASTFSNISFTKEKPVLNTNDQEEKTIQVFPNPVTDNVFTASFVSPVAGELTMKINDASGRSIFTKQVNVVKGPNAVPVRLNNGVIGTHFLTLEGKGVKFAPTTVVIVK